MRLLASRRARGTAGAVMVVCLAVAVAGWVAARGGRGARGDGARADLLSEAGDSGAALPAVASRPESRERAVDVHAAEVDARPVVAILRVRVVDEADQIVPGARLWLETAPLGDDRDFLIEREDDDTFTVTCRSHDVGYLVACAPKFGPATSDWVYVPKSSSLPVVDVTIVLRDRATMLCGRVVDARGEGVAGARVTIGSNVELADAAFLANVRLGQVTITDRDGRFCMSGVTFGLFPVTADAAGFVRYQDIGCVAAPAAPLEIRLVREAVITGTVRDEHGEPLPGIMVSDLAAGVHTRTALDGTFRLSGVPAGNRRIFAGREGSLGHDSRAATTVVVTEPGRESVWSPVLAAEHDLLVRVVDELDQPVAGQDVVVRAVNGPLGAFAMDAWSARKYGIESPIALQRIVTDKEGRATVRCVPDLSYTLTLLDDDHARGHAEAPAEVPPGITEYTLHVRGAELRTAQITASFREPVPWDSPPVRLVDIERGDSQTPVWRDDQKIAFRHLRPGRYRLSGYYRACTSIEHTLAAGESWDAGEIELGPESGFSFKAVSEKSPVTESANYTVFDASGDVIRTEGTAGRSGSGTVPPGDYVLQVVSTAFAVSAVPFVVRPGEVTKLSVQLSPGAERVFRIKTGAEDPDAVALRITDPSGRAVYRTDLYPKFGACRSGMRLVPGHYRVSASATIRGGATLTACAAFEVTAADPGAVLDLTLSR